LRALILAWALTLFLLPILSDPAGRAFLLLENARGLEEAGVRVLVDSGSGYVEVPRKSLVNEGAEAFLAGLPRGAVSGVCIRVTDAKDLSRLHAPRVFAPGGALERELRLADAQALAGPFTGVEWRFSPALSLDAPLLQRLRPWLLLAGCWLLGLLWLLREERFDALLGFVQRMEQRPWLSGGVAVVLLWIFLFEYPRGPLPILDGSWQMALADSFLNQRPFGSGFVFTYGPLGWLVTPQPSEGLAHARLLWELWGRLVLHGLTVVLLWDLPPLRRWLSLGVVLIFGSYFQDCLHLLLVTLVLVRWVLNPEARRWQLAAGLLVLGFLCLAKFTCLLLVVAGLACVATVDLSAGRWRRALSLPGVLLVGVCLAWVACGQPLGGLPAYVRGGLEFSSGYAWAMGIEPAALPQFLGIACVLLLAALVGLQALGGMGKGARLSQGAAGLIHALGLFMAWRQGFTRADVHMSYFFPYALVLACVLAVPSWRVLSAAIGVLALAGLWSVEAQSLVQLRGQFVERAAGWVETLVHGGGNLARWRGEQAQWERVQSLPAVRKQVGAESVDFFGNEQTYLFNNHLRYSPRPLVQNYSSYTSVQMRMNAVHLAGDSAPRFILARWDAIDGRCFSQSDALSLIEIKRSYTPVLSENGCLLLKRNVKTGAAPWRAEGLPVLVRRLQVGETWTLPENAAEPLWLRIKSRPGLWPRLRAFFLRAPELRLVLVDDRGAEHSYLLNLPGASEGFLLQPCLDNQAELEAFFLGQPGRRVRSLRVESPQLRATAWGVLELECFPVPVGPLG
jgi:hypothetical protein